MKPISENTMVTGGVLVVIIGATMYISNIQALANNTADRVERMVDAFKTVMDDVAEMKGDIKVIKQILEKE